MVQVEKRLIAVTGATGLQGGSVARYLLKDGSFRVRALTRKPSSEKALELQEKGAEVVYADLEDPKTLTAALQGVYGVFGVTNFWENMDGEKETQLGYALVDAAQVSGVQHFVWSTVSAPPPDLDVKHWASKAEVNKYLIESGLRRTSLYTTFYFENFLLFDFCKLTRVPSGPPPMQGVSTGQKKFVASWPLLYTDGPIGGYSVNETGAYSLEAFKNPSKWVDTDMYIPPNVFTPRDFVDALNAELPDEVEVELKEVDWTAFEKAKVASADIWTNMAAFYKAGGKMRYVGGLTSSSPDEVVEMEILPTRLGMREWVRKHRDEILGVAL